MGGGGGVHAHLLYMSDYNDYESQLPVFHDDVPGPAAREVVDYQVDAVRLMEPGSGQHGILRNDFQYQGYYSDESDDDVLSLGAVRPLPDAASWDGAEIVEISQSQADIVDHALLIGVQDMIDGPGTCCARMDDFDWVASPCIRELGLADRERDVGVPDVGREISEVLVALPALVVGNVGGPVVGPVVAMINPQDDCVSVEVLPDRGSGVITDVCRDFSCKSDGTGVTQNTHLQTESCPSSVEDLAGVPMSFPVVSNMEGPVDVRWEPASAVVPSGVVPGAAGEARLRTDVGLRLSRDSAMGPMSFPVGTDVDTQVEVGWEPTSVVLSSGCESGCPVGWLDTEADGWMVDEMMLDPEMSPIVFVRSAAVPAFLATKSEVFSLAVLAGGGGVSLLRQPPSSKCGDM